jgi:coatomer subunit beta
MFYVMFYICFCIFLNNVCVLTNLQFPDVADSVIHVLMDFLNGEGAIDVILFVRAISEQYPPLRLSILGKLTSSIRDMTSSPVLCVALWVLGTYIDGADPIAQVCTV